MLIGDQTKRFLWFKDRLGVSVGNTDDLEVAWLKSVTSKTGNLNDLWKEYFNLKLGLYVQFNDGIRSVLSGVTEQDIWDISLTHWDIGIASGEYQNFTTFAPVSQQGNSIVNPGRGELSDDLYASSNLGIGDTLTGILKCTGLSSSIPASATIDGIQIRVEKFASVSGVVDDKIQLYVAGVLSGDNNADGVTNWPTADPDTYVTYGGVTDLWGLALTAAQVNAVNFGVGVSGNGSFPITINIDHVQIAVTYS